MEKAYVLAEKILNDINTYSEKYTSFDGKQITTSDSIADLNEIIQNGFSLYKYMIDKDLYKDKISICGYMKEVEKYIEKLQINNKNAKKLTLSTSVRTWNEAKIAIALFANSILDYRDLMN